MSLNYLVKHQYRKTSENLMHASLQQQITKQCTYMFEVWWAIQ